MKQTKTLFLAGVLLAGLSSCGVGAAYVVNHNANTTDVQLSRKNYKVIDQVSGSSEVNYVLVFGGLKKRQLYANAYAEMVKSAELQIGARALTNVVTEEHVGGVPPFYYTRTITVSGNVIEFTD